LCEKNQWCKTINVKKENERERGKMKGEEKYESLRGKISWSVPPHI
jgi:hypothetical protein